MKYKYLAVVALALGLPGCASIPLIGHKTDGTSPAEQREVIPNDPSQVLPQPGASTSIWNEALKQKGTRIIVSRQGRSLWLMHDSTLLFKAPVAVGRTKRLIWQGKEYDFSTPVGKRKVIGKAPMPLWSPPDWHYFEIAQDQGLQPVFLKKTSKITLGDSTRIEVRKGEVGRVNKFGNFWPFTPGMEIIFDGKVFVPPVGTPQRLVPEILGTHKLEMGSGYLIHGTNEEGSIGEAVSHGCIRMYNADVDHLYELVDIGTPVFIY